MVCTKLLGADEQQAAKDKPAVGDYSSEISAIARGVEAKINLLIGFPMMVIEQTTDVARQLNIPEEEIQRWTTTKSMPDAKISRGVESSPNLVRIKPGKGCKSD